MASLSASRQARNTIYPDTPGYRVSGPSQDAARHVAPAAKSIQQRVLNFIASRPHGATGDEVAHGLALSPIMVRPRLSELNRKGIIRATGQRRRNDSGLAVTVWGAAKSEAA